MPLFFAFSAAMQSFIACLLSLGVLPLDWAALVTCCWCGEDADAGAVPFVVGASTA